jgi:small subunit ribosomal protein S6
MTDINRNYETTFILDSILEDDKVDAIVAKYTNFMTKNGSEVVKTEKWGRRKFAYSIKKRQTGHYVTIEFKGTGDIVGKLERAYHLDDNILRFLNIAFDKKTLAEKNEYFQKKEETAREREAAAKEEAQSAASVTTETQVEAKKVE